MTEAIKKLAFGSTNAQTPVGATVGAGYARALLEFASSSGADKEQLIKRSGIRYDDLLNPDNRVPVERLRALMRAAKDLCGDPALRFGAASLFVEMSIVGLICHSAETMSEALSQLNRYGRLVAEAGVPESADRYKIVRESGRIWLEDTAPIAHDYPEGAEFVWALFICEHERYFGDAPFAKAIHLPYAAPSYSAQYERILKVPVVFESNKNAILIDESWLSIKIPPADRYVFGIFSAHAEALLKSLKDSKSVRGKIESHLIPILHKGDVSMDYIAKKLGLSRQTLYRKLKSEGVSYARLLDELRHKMALRYLNGKKASVNEVAYLVGFSDVTAFSRAFKRWTGASSRAARSSLKSP